MAAEDSVRAIDGIVRAGLHHTPIWTGGAAASTGWDRGAVLISNGSGLLTPAADDAVTLIAGVALHDVGGGFGQTGSVSGEEVKFVPALPHLEFEASLEDQANGDHALVQANVYNDYAIQVTAGGIYYLDENDTTNVSGMVTRLIDAVGTVQGRVMFKFLDSVTLWV